MLPHASAEPDIRAGFNAARVQWGACRALAIQCIAAHETAYGTWPGRKEPMPRTNWGATHCARGVPGFKATDKRFEKGRWVTYTTCFATPASNAAGVALIIGFFTSRKLIAALDIGAPRHWVETMARAGYFDPAGIETYSASVSALAGEMVRTVPAYSSVRLAHAGAAPPNSKPAPDVRGLVGPATTKSYMRRVHADYRSFDADVMAVFNATIPNTPFPLSWFNAWLAQYTNWQKFYYDNIDGLTTGLSTAEYDETEKFELTLIEYRKQYTNYTGKKPTAPETPKPIEPTVSDAFGIPWTGILIVGGLAAGGYLLSNLPLGGKGKR